jgi:hypothetical protein
VIRPCSLRDLPAVRSLQHDGVWLDLFHHLLLQRSALSTALMAPVPWVGAGLATYVWPQIGRVQGFVQLLKRPRRYEADLLFLAPRLQDTAHGQLAWRQLLGGCTGEASAQALRRLFASAPEGGRESDLLTSQGFMVYANEEVYVLASAQQPPALAGTPQPRPRRPEDIWWLRRLYSIYTPQPVQHAEGYQNDDGQASLPLAWWGTDQPEQLRGAGSGRRAGRRSTGQRAARALAAAARRSGQRGSDGRFGALWHRRRGWQPVADLLHSARLPGRVGRCAANQRLPKLDPPLAPDQTAGRAGEGSGAASRSWARR